MEKQAEDIKKEIIVRVKPGKRFIDKNDISRGAGYKMAVLDGEYDQDIFAIVKE